MPNIEKPDLDRPISCSFGFVYFPFGSGSFLLPPCRCAVETVNGNADFRLELARAIDEQDSYATLSCTLVAEYATDEALAKVREISPTAALSSCVLTDWWFRVLPSAVLGAPIELVAPTILASNGLGTARIMATLTMETGVLLESMLQSRAPLEAVAEAQFEGISPRVRAMVRFESAALLGELLKRADSKAALPRQEMVNYFSQDLTKLPISIDGNVDPESLPRFADAMTDRVAAQFGRYVPSQRMADAPVVQLEVRENSSLRWALGQPFTTVRRIALPVNLLGAAQEQIERLGKDSVVRRTTLTSLPPLGQERVVALCNLPASRSGVDALGVTLLFPPYLPQRPEPVTVTGLFESAEDTVVLNARLSPGEPLRYRYSPFAVLTDELGTRQIDAPAVESDSTPLHLSIEEFPIDLAVLEVTPSLAELAVIAGTCTYEADGMNHQQKFMLDSGNLTTGIAVPRNRSSLVFDGYAAARNGSGQLRFGPIESLQARLDLTSFPEYGPQEIEIRCVFDDSSNLLGISLLPIDRDESPANITSLSFTPTEPTRTFRWSARSPFASGVRYRAFGAVNSEWREAQARSLLVLRSSELRKQERQRARLETAEAGPAAPESVVDPAGISPSYDVTDLLLFDTISDPTKKLYLPRYVMDVRTVSGQDRYRLSMSQKDGVSSLEINLVSGPDDSLGEQARTANPYPHRAVVTLDFLVAASSGARKSLEFTEISRTDNLLKASLVFATLAERDDVYRALTDEARNARLTVQRYFDVRVPERPASGGGLFAGTHLFALPLRPIFSTRVIPIPPPPAPITAPLTSLVLSSARLSPRISRLSKIERTPAQLLEASTLPLSVVAKGDFVFHPISRFVPSLPTPQVEVTSREEVHGAIRYSLSVVNWGEYSDDFFASAPDLPPCGFNKSASRTWVDIVDADSNTRLYGFCALGAAKQLNELWFAVPSTQPAPVRISVILTDRRTNLERRSSAVATSVAKPSTPSTHDVRIQLDQTVSPTPFSFPPALHSYIFEGVTPTTGSNQLIRYQLSWKGNYHTYLQDASRPKVVYVFADQFKMARRADVPYSPFATVRVATRPDGSTTDIVFDYVVAPYTDPKRLADARSQLLADSRFGSDQVDFQPFLTKDVRFFTDRPAAEGAIREQRPDASIVLQRALKDTLTMSLADFRLLFDAMYQRTASLFLGHVEIDVPNDVTQTIPFSARMDDLAGDVFSYEETVDSEGHLEITARNEIESPLNVQTISATIVSNGQRIGGLVEGSALPCPSLKPGSTIQFSISPETPISATAEHEIDFDLSGVTAIPDAEAVWNSILDRTTVDCFKFITAKAVITLFDPVAGREAERIVSILLEFDGGGTAELKASTLEAKVRLDYPVDDVVLGRPVSSTFRYTVTVIRANGRQDRDAAPRESSSDVFFVSVVV